MLFEFTNILATCQKIIHNILQLVWPLGRVSVANFLCNWARELNLNKNFKFKTHITSLYFTRIFSKLPLFVENWAHFQKYK